MTVVDSVPSFPDYFLSPDAVLQDDAKSWRFGRRPDYAKTRTAWRQTKLMNHTAGSLEELVENVVKNWEIEASHKTDATEWRTINHKLYEFRLNGGPPQPAEAMAKVGTYNALLYPSEYYSPEHNDFASSHKTFKRMMPTFAWEVLEVYGGPPKVAFKWRHWGTFQGDYTALNDKGEKVTIKKTGKVIDLRGMTTATLDDQLRLTSVDVYFDPMDMFRQMDEARADLAGDQQKAGDGVDAMAKQIAACPFLSAQTACREHAETNATAPAN
ncbi:hypothetical protein HK097_010708 [Rhizophlyctis rosea]|uniref:Pathogen-related protein n=1 Tax=Rhizophlyctis rosea TaxID=64517 RepID=A0AAD5X2Y3_9FUNG|nr:hypothetical protein HK097_010708 [Rhizophlyctis rosea]